MRNAVLLIALAALPAGCAPSYVTTQEGIDHSIGAAPADPEAVAKRYFERALKDSESARYQFGSALPGRLWGGAANGGWVYGYLMHVDVNAKNGFGGYVGYQQWQLGIRDNVVVFAIPPDSYHGLLM
jgi:hypothetical protein